MPEDLHTYASEEEVIELRREIRKLREEQESQKQQQTAGNGSQKNGQPAADGKEQDAAADKKGNADEQQAEPKKPHPVRNAILIAAGVAVLIGILLWWMHSRHFESTDDAQIDGHINGIAARVAGTISGVYVEENQLVKAGQLLADIDPRDYQTALEQARSQMSQAQAQIQAEQPNVAVTRVTNRTNISTAGSDIAGAEAGVASAQRDQEAAQAKVREAEANSAKAQADVDRYRPLAEKDEVPREQFDQVVATAKALAATVASARASAAASQGQVEQRKAQLDQARQHLEEAQQNSPAELAIRNANVASRKAAASGARSQLDQAMLNLSYCQITSPVDGVVAKRNAEVGQRVAPGQELVLVSQLSGLWVTANFRETQLRLMRPGQPVRISVDSLGADFTGAVESMPGATGAVTSILPPENASGNFVKVTQRLPVRIRIDPNQPGLERLRPGMSAEPRVTVR